MIFGSSYMLTSFANMNKRRSLLVLLLYICSVYKVVGDFILEVKIYNYSNPSNGCSVCSFNNSFIADGCCDFDMTCGACDSYFEYCLPLTYRGTTCRTKRETSLVLDNDQPINFSDSRVLGLSNPLPLRGPTRAWSGTKLLLTVYDYDPADNDANDTVDKIEVVIPKSTLQTGMNRRSYTGRYMISTVELSFRVICADNYYGPNCTQFCRESCTCDPGYTGEFCHINIDDCAKVNCSNNGMCVDGEDDYDCVCNSGYTGEDCEMVNECAGVNCSGHGQCVDGMNSYLCTCDPGYTGEHCEENIDECRAENVTCSGHGQCVDGMNSYNCTCDPGYTGEHCEEDVNECETMNISCGRHGQCIDGVNNYNCTCDLGYTGEHCEENINECEMMNISCGRHGQCIDGVNNYNCTCDAGYTGEQCEENINECDTMNINCGRHGQCIDGVNNYTCLCSPGFIGSPCTEEDAMTTRDMTVIIGGAAVTGVMAVLLLIMMVMAIALVVRRQTRKRAVNKHGEKTNAGDNPAYGLDDSDATIDVRTFPQDSLHHNFQNPIYCTHKHDSNGAQDKQKLNGNRTASDTQTIGHKSDVNSVYDSPDSIPKFTSQREHTNPTTYSLLSKSTPSHGKEITHTSVGVKSQDNVQAISDRVYAVPGHMKKAANFETSVEFDNPAYSSPFDSRAAASAPGPQQRGAGGLGSVSNNNNHGLSPAISVDVNYSQPTPHIQHVMPTNDHKMANSYDALSPGSITGACEKQLAGFDDPVYADEAGATHLPAVAAVAPVKHGSTVHLGHCNLPPPGFDDPGYEATTTLGSE